MKGAYARCRRYAQRERVTTRKRKQPRATALDVVKLAKMEAGGIEPPSAVAPY
jgi:hypothetical protein